MPLDRLIKYSKSSIGLQRLVHIKMITEIAELVGFSTTAEKIIPLLESLSCDNEQAIRQFFVKQLAKLSQVIFNDILFL